MQYRLEDQITIALERLLAENALDPEPQRFVRDALDGLIPPDQVNRFLRGREPNVVDMTGAPLSEPRRRKSRKRLLPLLGLVVAVACTGAFAYLILAPANPPTAPVSRSEFVIRLVEALRETGQGPDGKGVEWPDNCSITVFQDIDAIHPLAQDCRLAYALSQRILEGNREGESLDPDRPVMRIEAARFLILGVPKLRKHYDRYYRRYEDQCRREMVCESIQVITHVDEFRDVPSFSSHAEGGWYYYHVYAATELGVIRPRTSYRFDIEGEVILEEMEEWLCRALPERC